MSLYFYLKDLVSKDFPQLLLVFHKLTPADAQQLLKEGILPNVKDIASKGLAEMDNFEAIVKKESFPGSLSSYLNNLDVFLLDLRQFVDECEAINPSVWPKTYVKAVCDTVKRKFGAKIEALSARAQLFIHPLELYQAKEYKRNSKAQLDSPVRKAA